MTETVRASRGDRPPPAAEWELQGRFRRVRIVVEYPRTWLGVIPTSLLRLEASTEDRRFGSCLELYRRRRLSMRLVLPVGRWGGQPKPRVAHGCPSNK